MTHKGVQMTANTTAQNTYPHDRPAGRCPFDPPPEYGEWREEEGLTRVTLWDGRESYVATRLDLFKEILSDDRFSAVWTEHMPTVSPATAAPTPTRSTFLRMDDPEHARHRRMIARDFTAPKVAKLKPKITRLCAEMLDEMEQAGHGVDLVELYAQALPSHIACEILGVPIEDAETFQSNTKTMMRADVSREEALTAGKALLGYMGQLVESKKGSEGDDTLSRLVNSAVVNGDLTEQEAVLIGVLLIVGGHETTANMVAMGALVLMENPDQLELFKSRMDDPEFVATAVDELLRYISVIIDNLNRVALEDVEVAGTVIKKGEGVILSVPAANRDPRGFDDPDTLDLTRVMQTRHAAFGYGIHQCLGQVLARAELEIALPMLFQRFPDLRTTQSIDDVAFKDSSIIRGLERLPVAW